jgi:hypothetical protein
MVRVTGCWNSSPSGSTSTAPRKPGRGAQAAGSEEAVAYMVRVIFVVALSAPAGISNFNPPDPTMTPPSGPISLDTVVFSGETFVPSLVQKVTGMSNTSTAATDRKCLRKGKNA